MVHVAVLLLMWFWYGTVSAAALLSHELGESVWLNSGSLAWFSGGGGEKRERKERRERERLSVVGRRRRETVRRRWRERDYIRRREIFIHSSKIEEGIKETKNPGSCVGGCRTLCSLLLLFLFLPAITLHLPWEDLECSGRKSEAWKPYSTLNKWGWLAYDGDTKGQTQKAEVWGYR